MEKIKESGFVKDSSYMVFSTIAMQVIAIGTTFILARVFDPEVFGFHSTFRSVIVILSILMTLMLETAIVLPEEKRDKTNVYRSALMNVGIVTLVVVAIHGVLKLFDIDILYSLFNINNLGLFLLVISGSVLVGITNIEQNMLVSLKQFKTIAFSRLVLPIFFFISAIVLTLFTDSLLTLVVAQVIAYIVLLLFFRYKNNFNFRTLPFDLYKKVVGRYKDIVKYTSSISLLNAFSLNVPSLLLLSFFGAEALGFYALGSKLISIPTQLVSSSFTQVFYKRMVDIYNTQSENLYAFVLRTIGILLALGIVTFTIAYFLAPIVIPWILGVEWIGAIEIVQYLCLWQALMIVNSPISTLTILLKRQKELFIFQVLFLIFRVISIWYPYSLGYDYKTAILMFALVGLFFNLCLLVYYIYIVKKVKGHQGSQLY